MKFSIALALSLALAAPASAQAPKIGGKNANFDFDAVVKGAKVTHTFVVKNEGQAPLIISKITNSCDCFSARFDETIAPGKEGNIDVTIDTSKQEGPILLTGVIHSNDPERPTTQLSIKGLVKGPIALLPRDHFALTAIRGENKVSHLFLEINRPKPLKVKGIESTNPLFKPRVETVTPGKKYRITVKASSNADLGLHSGMINIKTDDPEKPVIPIDGSILIISSIAIEPGTLFLSRMTPEEAMKGMKNDAWKVVLKNVHQQAFSVLEVTTLAPFLGATYRPLKDKKSYEVLVEVKPNTILKQGKYFADLTVKTNLPDAQNLKVPVSFEVR
jgi:Protein of unknown function (DUF1573)